MAALAMLITLLSVSMAQPALADTDPFPGVPHMGTIPNTRINSASGQSQSDFDATAAVQAFSCPEGSGRGIGVDLNNSASQSDHVFYYHCIKTWQAQTTIDAWADYRATAAAAFAAAEAESRAWNEAHPGEQKCVQWGPLTDPNGATSSGGVCANAVPAPSPSTDAQDPLPTPSSPAPSPEPISSAPSPEPISSAPLEIEIPELVIFDEPIDGDSPLEFAVPDGYLYASKVQGLYFC